MTVTGLVRERTRFRSDGQASGELGFDEGGQGCCSVRGDGAGWPWGHQLPVLWSLGGEVVSEVSGSSRDAVAQGSRV